MELTDGINSALGEHALDYDIDAIAAELRAAGYTHVDEVDGERFWAVAEVHTLSDLADVEPLDVFRAEVTRALATERPVGVAAVWRRGGVTMTITGASRVRLSWPQETAAVEVTTLGGATVTRPGADITSWAALWDIVRPLLAQWTDTVAERRAAVDQAHRQVDELAEALRKARAALKTAAGELSDVLPDGAAVDGAFMTGGEVADYLGVLPNSVRRQMSRWEIEPVYERGVSGRAEARWPRAEVEARVARRPGRGHRSDLAGKPSR